MRDRGRVEPVFDGSEQAADRPPYREQSRQTNYQRQPRRVGPIVAFLVLAILIAAGGWHYVIQKSLENTMTANLNGMVSGLLSGTHVIVQINAVSNLVVVHVISDLAHLEYFLQLLPGAPLTGALEEQLDKQLTVVVRDRLDFYGMLLPYKTTIVFEPVQQAKPVSKRAPVEKPKVNVKQAKGALYTCADVIGGNYEQQEAFFQAAQIESWSRYHLSVIESICEGDFDAVRHEIDYDFTTFSEAKAIMEVLGISGDIGNGERTPAGVRYSNARVGLSPDFDSARAGNLAGVFAEDPNSMCGQLVGRAIEGDRGAVLVLQNASECSNP